MAYKDPDEPFTRLSVAEVRQMMENGHVQLIDVSDAEEYELRHVPGAVHIPVGKVFARREELSHESHIVFICPIGQRSVLACEMAAAAGFTRLYNMEGGTQAWIKEGYPLEE
jgi:rhodanese-related sulfurtransferase